MLNYLAQLIIVNKYLYISNTISALALGHIIIILCWLTFYVERRTGNNGISYGGGNNLLSSVTRSIICEIPVELTYIYNRCIMYKVDRYDSR